MRLQRLFSLITGLLLLGTMAFAQGSGDVRGFVYDKDNGEPILFANVYLAGTTFGGTTDVNGFFNISKVPEGKYILTCEYLGYDSTGVEIEVFEGKILNQSLYLSESATDLSIVDVSAKRDEAKRDVRVSVVTVTPKDIKSLPGLGGEPDLAQYLQILPGVIFTGDQGGQLYIRGGSPIQNKILLDGMTIYNPFHSIGFFSVVETDIIRNVDVLTGGFNAQYGGRISSVIDITSRDGNKKRFGGTLGVNPFQGKLLLEGPIIKLDESVGTSTSFILTGKHSYLDKTSKSLYSYVDSTGLPYSFTDLYGKVSVSSKNGSKLNFFGFNFRDNVDFSEVANLGWTNSGGGANFVLIPGASKFIIGGNFSFSKYDIELQEADNAPRRSSIGGFDGGLNFTFYGENSEFKYGFDVNGFRTEFLFTNAIDLIIEQIENTSELSGYFKAKFLLSKLVFEPSLRVHYYASLNEFSLEPRLGLKLNATDFLRFKFAGGIFSQNLIAATNEQDIVNLFIGFLSAPDRVNEPNSSERASSRLQRSIHAIGGVEIDLTNNLELNIEPYYKSFPQLITINRNKLSVEEPDFVTETGRAFGLDVTLTYETSRLFLYGAYSLGNVKRDDGQQIYPTHFDRRHNVNLVANYKLGAEGLWEVSARWNLGSGFPFTLTQGFYEDFNFDEGINTDYVGGNGDLGIIYSEERNSGRLPYYHRLDLSLKRSFNFTKYTKLELYGSVTNVYDRDNIFYFDRIRFERVNQLPILPSAGLNFSF
ncbi:MAG: TonB-dependent receptor [Bacteroidota bacterium]